MAPPKKRKRDEGQKGISRFFLNTVPNESTGGEEGRVTGVEEQVRGAEGGDHYLLPMIQHLSVLNHYQPVMAKQVFYMEITNKYSSIP